MNHNYNHSSLDTSKIIDENKINQAIFEGKNLSNDKNYVREILQKSLELKGLTTQEASVLLQVNDQDLQQEIFSTAKKVKEEIYGKRLVIFAPLYASNFCQNNCLYCAFRVANKQLKRKALNQAELIHETELLINQGHKRLLLVSGEAYPKNDFHYITDAINTIYSVKQGNGAIRRINVNIAPLNTNEFKELKSCGIGTYQLFQETYHRETYKKVHISGKKADYDWRLDAIDRAITAGIDDVGIGTLFGLADWRFDTLGLIEHSNYLNTTFNVGPHTISVPRIEPASGSELASDPNVKISDENFFKIIAVLRLAVPYTGIIMSTRETPEVRRMTFSLGVSQISAGSCTNPGGYSENNSHNANVKTNDNANDDSISDDSQFSLGDHRTLDEVIRDVVQNGYLPSFCTACYRSGRTGEDFMCLAKPGNIKNMCFVNSLLTFYEYLLDYAPENTQNIGKQFIHNMVTDLPPQQCASISNLLHKMQDGQRDLYV